MSGESRLLRVPRICAVSRCMCTPHDCPLTFLPSCSAWRVPLRSLHTDPLQKGNDDDRDDTGGPRVPDLCHAAGAHARADHVQTRAGPAGTGGLASGSLDFLPALDPAPCPAEEGPSQVSLPASP